LSTAPTPNNRKQTEESQRERNRTRRQTEREDRGEETATNRTPAQQQIRQDSETGRGAGGEEGRGWGGVMRRAGGAGLSPLCFESNYPTIFSK